MLLIHPRRNLTLLRGINALILEILALCPHAVGRIHALLQLVVLPPKHIVSVLPEPRVVAVAEVERLGAVGRPQRLVVKGRRVPYHFVHELWDAHGVSGRAGAAEAEEVGGAGGGVRDVRFVVWGWLDGAYM
jgi:hypothetical protein